MSNERAILCGNVPDGDLPVSGEGAVRLRLWGPHRNVWLRIEDIRRRLVSDVPAQFLDLLEIATYVYCADQAVTRGGDGVDDAGANWRRRLFLRIPVRDPDLWNSPRVLGPLVDTLSFLSEDEYLFEFLPQSGGPAQQAYLEFAPDTSNGAAPEQVVMFSGGLDSLGGAIQEAVLDQRRVLLVTHRSTDKVSLRHRRLCDLLAAHAGGAAPLHIPVSINKKKALSREYTQRSRSFLYACLGATLARMFGLSGLRFYENGVVSLNLPLTPQVVGAKATRTTHPRVISGFARLLSAVAGRPFTVENPFLTKTKSEIVELIGQAGCADAIQYSTSCTHSWQLGRGITHCGACSQCIDRRFSVLAAGQEAADPAEGYRVDLLRGERDEGEPRTMLASYVETASAVAKMSAVEFFGRYGEVGRAIRHMSGLPDANALTIHALYLRHARQVVKVVDSAIAAHASAIRNRELPASCLLRLVCDSGLPVDLPAMLAMGPAEPSAPLKDYVFRRDGMAWQVRYAGGKVWTMLPSKGAAYLHILLSQPRVALNVVDTVYQVAKEPAVHALGSAGEGADKDSFAAYRRKYTELQEEMEQARRDQDFTQQQRIQNDLDWLAGQIGRDQGLGRRMRRDADDRERIRKSFRAAIRRTLKEIA